MTLMLPPEIFREYDIRGIVGESLTADAVRIIGQAFASRLREEGKDTPAICVGYDGRLSSPALEQALVEGLIAGDCRVIRIGLGPTPLLYFSVFHLAADAGVMITGSHNPPDHNGLKMMIGKRPFFGDDIQALRQCIESNGLRMGRGSVESQKITTTYLETLRSAYPADAAAKLRVAWDTGNGAAGEVVTALADELPGEHRVLFGEIDGRFPNHHPDPAVEENLADLKRLVVSERYDLGIAFDGDGDRIGVVDDEGEVLWGDQLLAYLAKDVLRKNPGGVVIADIKSSQLVFDTIARAGGKPLMWKTGHSNIKSKMQETGAVLAGEMSGHMFFADTYYGFDDAIYAAVRLLGALIRSGQPLSAWRKQLPVMYNTPEIRIECADDKKFAFIADIAAELKASGATLTDIDGIRVTTPDGWWLLRASNTQPMLVARAESPSKEGLERLRKVLAGYLP